MKRLLVLLIALLVLIAPWQAFAAQEQIIIDTSNSMKGYISVELNNINKTHKVLVQKGETQYFYTFTPNNKRENLPLQLGEGNYKITVYENISGTSYRSVKSLSVSADFQNDTDPFLQSVQLIKWDTTMPAIVKAAELVKGLESDEAKVAAIHNYVVSNVKYDYNKASGLTSTYIPDNNVTYATGMGICYDFSSLMAGMLRSVGIPAKLVKGYTPNATGYHAWNEVLINGKWVVIDASYDSQMKAAGSKYSMVKEAKLYNKTSEF
jgi:transglutaminase-like putative cysteine protease